MFIEGCVIYKWYIVINKNEYEKAKKDFKQCLKIEPNDDKAIKYLTYIMNKEKSTPVKRVVSNNNLNTMTFDLREVITDNESLLNKKRNLNK